MSVVRRLRGSLAIARQMPGQRQWPYRDPERVAEIRDARVRTLVRYAAETVPHYRELFRAEGIDAREIRTAADLDRLPLLTKAEIQRDPRRFVSESKAGRTALRVSTSGSTGLPLELYHDRASLVAIIPWAARQRAVERQLLGTPARTSVTFRHRRPAAEELAGFLARETFRPLAGERHVLPLDLPVEAAAAELLRLRPDVISGYGNHLEALFRTIEVRGLEIRPPRLVVFFSEAMTTEGRAFVEERFGAPVLGLYGAMESILIGFTCEERGPYHLHEDLCHVREVDGELVLTNLVNRATVLINYRIGDLGRVGPGGCPCGRTTRLLTELRGRASTVLWLPDGEPVHPLAVWGTLNDQAGILRFQLVQRAPASFELRLATADEPAFERAAGAAVPRLRSLLGGAAVAATRHDELRSDNGGKFATVVPLRDDP